MLFEIDWQATVAVQRQGLRADVDTNAVGTGPELVLGQILMPAPHGDSAAPTAAHCHFDALDDTDRLGGHVGGRGHFGARFHLLPTLRTLPVIERGGDLFDFVRGFWGWFAAPNKGSLSRLAPGLPFSSLAEGCPLAIRPAQPFRKLRDFGLKSVDLFLKPMGLFLKPMGLFLKLMGLFLKPRAVAAPAGTLCLSWWHDT